MTFKLIKQTTEGLSLLGSDDAAPVARKYPLAAGRRRAGVLMETIGTVASPFYIARLEGNWPVGSEFEISVSKRSR
ncbi:MAG: hypothetical protein AABW54_00430 [Candidatus Micrarchaeota archaeon]